MGLMNFQRDAVSELAAAMNKAEMEIVLDSPTGSGKTVMLTTFMDEYMKANSNIVFVWLTPGKGDLEEQSKAKMERYFPEAQTKNLADVMTGGFAAGDAVFINWQKLNMKDNVALKDSERTNFLEWIQKAFDAGIHFKVVIDESHENFTGKSAEVVSYFKTDKIIRASATPLANPNAIWVKVDEADVIAEGLIKKMILINPDFPIGKKFENEDVVDFLLEQAYDKREEIRKVFVKKEVTVNPLIVVQLPNNSDEQLQEVENWFVAKGVDRTNGLLAVWLANDKENLDGIAKNDAKQEVVVIKQAIATGWDCPRAHILVKLRRHTGERFEIQTIGRIRRMPEARHYGDDILDSCYLYTLDSEFTAGARNTLGNRALNAMRIFLKPEHKEFSLIKEQRTMVTDTRDPILALAAVYSYYKKQYKLSEDYSKNRLRLTTGGYEFSEDILNKTISGDASVLDEIFDGDKMLEVSFSEILDTHKHGQYFRHALGEVGAGCGMGYNEVRGIFSRLFGEEPAFVQKVVGLKPKALYAFAINNMKKFKDDFREAMAAELPGETKDPVSEKQFKFPLQWLMLYDPNPRLMANATKNVYDGYLMSARPRSSGELEFEQWAEKYADWWYRNGDKGDEYFSIVYQDNSGKQRLFYPDYIVRVGGTDWILEIKGGFNTSGASENIDPYAPKKASALKAYGEKHSIKCGFVCYDEQTRSLLVSTEGFPESVEDPRWKRITDVIH